MSSVGELSSLAERGGAVHLTGIGGAGMAGLALLLQARGAQVSGCDRTASETTADLRRRGIRVYHEHSPDHVKEAAALVYTAAVPSEHPELAAARARGLPVIKRAHALGELVSCGRLVAIAGTHGKTTTSALTGLALEAAGGDPTALVGGRLTEWRGNARIGSSDLYVVEADEYDRSFLALWPRIAVITSVEAEHLDIYGNYAELEAAFDEFVSRVPAEGSVIGCADDPGARRRLANAPGQVIAYGLGDGVDLGVESLTFEPERTRFAAVWRGRALGEFELALRGRHNVLNALAVLGVMLALGLEPRLAAPAFARFAGVERRFERLGEVRGITVIDDYAHHPTEVAATLEAARQEFPGRRLVAAFQPHLYTRTRAFADAFGRELAKADAVFVTAIYPARERPIPGVTGRGVAEAARRAAPAREIHYADSLDELRAALRRELRERDVLITLGAGDIGSVAHTLLDELRQDDVEA